MFNQWMICGVWLCARARIYRVWLQSNGIIEEWNQTYIKYKMCVFTFLFAFRLKTMRVSYRRTSYNNATDENITSESKCQANSSEFCVYIMGTGVSVHARVSDLMANFLYHWILYASVCVRECVCVFDYFNSLEWNLNFWRRKICEIFTQNNLNGCCVLVCCCYVSFTLAKYKYCSKTYEITNETHW